MSRLLCLTVVAALAAACGPAKEDGDGDPTTVGPEDYAGRWTESGTWSFTSNGATTTAPASAELELTVDGSETAVTVPLLSGCGPSFTTDERSATLSAPVTCPDGQASVTFSGGELHLSADGKELAVQTSGTRTGGASAAAGETFVFSAMLNKVRVTQGSCTEGQPGCYEQY